MDITKLESLLTVAQVAELHDVPTRVVRKAAKNGTLPGTIKVLGKYGFDPELVESWEPPEPGTFGVRASAREDGRRRYRIYLTEAESVTLLGQGFEVTDPRAAAKARRAAKKAAEASGVAEAPVSSAEEEDPFADFGV